MAKKFSIHELSSMTGLYKRTIHFYISEKLIDPPYSKGSNAYYGEDHYYKLMLIKELRKTHLKLNSIKDELMKLSFDEIKNIISRNENRRREMSIVAFSENAFLSSQVETLYIKPSNISFVPDKKVLPVYENTEVKPVFNYETNLNTEGIKTDNSVDTTPVAWNKLQVNQNFELNIRSDYYKKHESSINKIFNELNKIFPKEEI